MIIGKVNSNWFIVKDKREWSDVEAFLDTDLEAVITVEMENFQAIQAYLQAVHVRLRPNGGADVGDIEVPKCLLDLVSKRRSTSSSRKTKSSSSTKGKATNSGSQSTEDTSASSADTAKSSSARSTPRTSSSKTES